MKKDVDGEAIAELTLLLAWLTGWNERSVGGTLRCAWKGYDFELLDKLRDQGFIGGALGAKSIVFTEEGIAHAKLLETKYLAKELPFSSFDDAQ